MNIVKRIVCLILAVAMVAALSACDFGGSKGSVSVPASTFEDGSFVYSVVRSGSQTITVVENAVKDIRSAMKKNFGATINILKDTAYQDFDGSYEILIGDTNREESQKAKDMLIANRSNNAKDFIVAVMRDKIVIQAIDVEVIEAAAEWFVNTFCQSLETWSMLKTDYVFIYEHVFTETADVVNNVALGDYAVVMPRKISYIVGLAAEDYIDYYTTFGYAVSSIVDTEETKDYEILIGDCDRAESKSVTVEGDNYIIKVIGNKLVIKGGNDLATNRAIRRFLEEVIAKSSSTGIKWSDGYTINGKYDAEEEGAYTLNFADDFDGSKIDYTKWSDYMKYAGTVVDDSCLGNEGKVYWDDVYDDGNCLYTGSNKRDLEYQSGGNLILATQRVTDYDFVASELSTFWTMNFRYGIVEVRAKFAEVPAATSFMFNGAGAHSDFVDSYTSRFGSNSRNVFTELNLVENFGRNDTFASNVHRWWGEVNLDGSGAGSAHASMDGSKLYVGDSLNNKKYNYDTEKYGDVMTDDYHTYSFYWDDEVIKFAFDGRTFCTYDFVDNKNTGAHDQPIYFIPRCRMGCAKYGATYDPETHPDYCELKIDYFKIYQSEESNSQMAYAWPELQANGTTKYRYPDNPIVIK